MKKQERNVVTPMNDAPIVKGKLIKVHSRLCQVKITCPYCGKCHVHGAGEDGSAANGHRVAHCTGGRPSPGYIVIVK